MRWWSTHTCEQGEIGVNQDEYLYPATSLDRGWPADMAETEHGPQP